LLPPPNTEPPPAGASGVVLGPALPPPPADKPVWKKWPFWAVVGGVVVGSAVVYAVSRDDKLCSSGCTQLNYR